MREIELWSDEGMNMDELKVHVPGGQLSLSPALRDQEQIPQLKIILDLIVLSLKQADGSNPRAS